MNGNPSNRIHDLAHSFRGLIERLITYRNNPDSADFSRGDWDVEELEKYFTANFVKTDEISTDLIKIWLLLLREDYKKYVPKILPCLNAQEYGWCDDEYVSTNECRDCRKDQVQRDSTPVEAFSEVREIFFDTDCGWITLFVLSYCIAGLFRSKLTPSTAPLYLQIACGNNTPLRKLISEVVKICDVNIGIHGVCAKTLPCGNDRIETLYPSNADDNMESLLLFKDSPLVIDGYGSGHNYKALLKKFANKSNQRAFLGNILPVFTCPEVKLSPNNFFSMDLERVQISDEYVELLKEKREYLASIVFHLIDNFSKCLFSESAENTDKNAPEGELSFPEKITNAIKPTPVFGGVTQTAQSVGILNFFFRGFLQSFEITFNEAFPDCGKFKYLGETWMRACRHHIATLAEQAEESLAKTYGRYSHAPTDSIEIDVEGVDPKDEKRIKRKARKYASDIKESYQSYGVSLSITKATVKGERYIFDVDLSGIRNHKFFKEAENVQKDVSLEYFNPVKQGQSFSIVASEKELNDNSLISILKSPEFKNSEAIMPYAVGYDEFGDVCIYDIKYFPNLLIGGTTTSGKSSAIRCLLTSIAYKFRGGEINVIIMDLLGEKSPNFKMFEDYPFLSCPVTRNADDGLKALLYLEQAMDERLNLEEEQVALLPHVVCVIDEYPELFATLENKENHGKLKKALTRLLRKSRNARIHLVFAVHNPEKKHMVCGIEDVPARMALRVPHHTNSTTIISRGGAEKLSGRGKMIFDSINKHDARLTGAFISVDDTKKLLDEIKKDFKQENPYPFKICEDDLDILEINTAEEMQDQKKKPESTTNEKLIVVIFQLLKEGKIANSHVQKLVKRGNDVANELLDILVDEYNLIPALVEGQRSARELNPVDEINIEKIKELFVAEKNYLLRKAYSEDEICTAFGKIPGILDDVNPPKSQ